MFPRQLIIQLLVLNIVFSNFAWAIDECAYDFTNPGSSDFFISMDHNSGPYQIHNEQQTDNDTDIPGSFNVKCDAHCFANMRLIYIAFDFTTIQYINNHSFINYYPLPWFSVIAQPPVKPPRV